MEENVATVEKAEIHTKKSEFEIPSTFNFNDNPNVDEATTRSYNTQAPPNNTGQAVVRTPVAEFGDVSVKPSTEASTNGSATSSRPNVEEPVKPKPVNKDLYNASDKEKEVAAEQLTDMILDGYDKLHQFVTPYIQISDKKITKLIAKGLINPNTAIPTIDNEMLTTVDFLKINNQSIAQVLTHDKIGFDEKVRPAMIREFKKRGAGLSDTQYIMLMFGKDIGTKTAMVLGLRKTMHDTLELFKQMHQEQMEAMAGHKPPINADQIIREEPKSNNPTVERPPHVQENEVEDQETPPEVE